MLRGFLILASLSLTLALPAQESAPIIAPEAIYLPEVYSQGAVSAAERHATEAGLAVLQEGGNAVDAAVTVGFTLAVTYPRAGNLAGGGFMMVHLADEGRTLAIDYRERAPLSAHRDLFLNEDGNADSQLSRYSPLASGVPGTVLGLEQALETYGTIPLTRAIAPAIQLAEEGFAMYPNLRDSLRAAQSRLIADPEIARVFYPGGEVPALGTILRQPDLARSLRAIAEEGSSAFYTGSIAQQLVDYMAAEGGLITMEDLAAYAVVEREPARGRYRGLEVLSMPPPSSGGAHIVQMLNLLEPFELRNYGHNSAQTIHLMAEAMKLAYADRSEYLGDPDFSRIPLAEITSPAYAEALRPEMDPDVATPATDIRPGPVWDFTESDETTHFSVIDRWGNAVANTYTLNFSYGSGIMIPDTGILLNNQMDDFSAKPGVPNAYGLIGGDANAIEPGKRMLSSMSPTIVLRDGEVYLVTGSPGGSRIITTVLQILLNVMEHGMNPAEAEHALRIHHQWTPDVLYYERGLSPDTLQILIEMGYSVEERRPIGSTKTLMRIDGTIYGSADPRRGSGIVLGY